MNPDKQIANKNSQVANYDPAKRLADIQRVLAEVATPEKIRDLVIELCEARDLKFDPNGNPYDAPNWKARKDGLDSAISLMNLDQRENVTTSKLPTRIVLQVIQPKVQKEVVDVKEVRDEKPGTPLQG